MLAKLLILSLSAVVAVGQKVTGVSFGLLDSNGTAVDPGETPASLSIGFTTTTAGTNTVSIGLPSGLVSGDGTFSTGNRRRLDEEDSDFYGDSFGRRLAVTCEPYGTATVTGGGTTLTVQVRVPGTASDPCTAGSAISMSLTGNSATFNSVSTGTLAFTLSTNVDGDPIGISYTVDSTPGANVVVIGDPITWFNGMKYKFWLPVGQMMPLLETAEMTVWASTFQGPNVDYQWFDRFKVTDKDGAELVDIKVNRVLPGSNRSQFHNNFNQLDIKMSGKTIRRRGEQLFGVNGDSKPVKVGVGARRVNPPRFHHSPILEFVMVESDSISFMVHGSHAGAEFPGDFEKQVKYTHLDWVTLDMVDPKENGWKGILPQIWQIQPRTVEVEDLLVAPSKKQMAVCTATE